MHVKCSGNHPGAAWLALQLKRCGWEASHDFKTERPAYSWLALKCGWEEPLGHDRLEWPIEWCFSNIYGHFHSPQPAQMMFQRFQGHLLDLKALWQAEQATPENSRDADLEIDISFRNCTTCQRGFVLQGWLPCTRPLGLLESWHHPSDRLYLCALSSQQTAFTYLFDQDNQFSKRLSTYLSDVSFQLAEASPQAYCQCWPSIELTGCQLKLGVTAPGLAPEKWLLESTLWLMIRSIWSWLSQENLNASQLFQRTSALCDKLQMFQQHVLKKENFFELSS